MVLKELCALRGVSGDEGRVREFIRDRIAPHVTSVRVDRMGNLIAEKRGTGENRRRILLSAAMDEPGLTVLGVNDNGLISYDPVGDIDPRVIVSKPVRIGDDGIPGVIGAKAIHLQSDDEMESVFLHDKLYVDIGAKDKASAETKVHPGDSITFESQWMEFGDGMVKSRALENRMGCMVLMSLLEGEYPCDVTGVFTVQSRVGHRGAAAAAYSAECDAALILNSIIANDLDDPEKCPAVTKVKAGAVVAMMDASAIVSLPLFARLKAIAREQSIPCQDARGVIPGGETGEFQRQCGPRAVCAVSVPCRYMNTPSNVAAFADIEAQYRLLDAFLTAGGAF